MFGPDPNAVHPNPAVPSLCFIKNTITRPNIIVGDYTYYDDPVDSDTLRITSPTITNFSATGSSSASSAPSPGA